MRRDQPIRKSFYVITCIVFAASLALTYSPMFSGRIPFPEDLVMRHAAWDARSGAAAPKPLPEISDLITSFYPYHALAAQALAQRDAPLWNPYILGGTPLAAHSQAGQFYPLNLPYLLLPLHLAWTICIMAR